MDQLVFSSYSVIFILLPLIHSHSRIQLSCMSVSWNKCGELLLSIRVLLVPFHNLHPLLFQLVERLAGDSAEAHFSDKRELVTTSWKQSLKVRRSVLYSTYCVYTCSPAAPYTHHWFRRLLPNPAYLISERALCIPGRRIRTFWWRPIGYWNKFFFDLVFQIFRLTFFWLSASWDLLSAPAAAHGPFRESDRSVPPTALSSTASTSVLFLLFASGVVIHLRIA